MATTIEAVSNATLASPRAEAAAHVGAAVAGGIVARIVDGMSFWTVLLTVVLGAVLYDQCKFTPNDNAWRERHLTSCQLDVIVRFLEDEFTNHVVRH